MAVVTLVSVQCLGEMDQDDMDQNDKSLAQWCLE